MRTDIGCSAGHTARHASNTSSGKRARFASVPPYSSSRTVGQRRQERRQQVAVGHVQLEQVEAGLGRALASRRRTRRARASMSARVISRGTWLVAGRYGSGDGAISGQLPSGSGSSSPSHISFVEPLRPRGRAARRSRAVPCACTKSTIRFHAGDVLVAVQAAAAGRDPALGATCRSSRSSRARRRRSPRAPRCTRWKSPGVPSTRRVHVHRRDDDAVGAARARAAGTA